LIHQVNLFFSENEIKVEDPPVIFNGVLAKEDSQKILDQWKDSDQNCEFFSPGYYFTRYYDARYGWL
jgi:hypothetical protein